MANIETARQRKAREALAAKETWTPRDALVAALADIDSGVLKPEALVIVYSEEEVVAGDPGSRVGRYVAGNGSRGQQEAFWMIGMLARCLNHWTRS